MKYLNTITFQLMKRVTYYHSEGRLSSKQRPQDPQDPPCPNDSELY